MISVKKERFLPVAVVLLASVTAFPAEKLDLSDRTNGLKLWAKASCSMDENKPVLHWWAGRMYSRVDGEKDRLLFNVQGMNIRRCNIRHDPVRGLGVRSVSREVMFYLDPETGEVARSWENPWTGEVVDVIHVANDPVNMRDFFWERDENGEPETRWSEYTLKDGFVLKGGGAARLFYENPLGGDYQQYVGGTYHAMELGTSAVSRAAVEDPSVTEVEDGVISWARVSNWLPWMKMGSKRGMVIFHTAGKRMKSWASMPAVIRDEIARNYPEYREPPPLDDARPNDTSWTVFKRHIDAKRAAKDGD